MIVHNHGRQRRLLALGISLLALAAAGTAAAQETAAPQPATAAPPAPVDITRTSVTRADGMVENRYFMTMLVQSFDGVRERSFAQKAGFARLRKGDESWITINYGDGAMSINTPGHVSYANFGNDTPTEAKFAYDYKTHMLRGNTRPSDYNNRFVAPLLGQSPALGQDAKWTLNVTTEQIGVPRAQGGVMAIALSRHYFSQGGQDFVLLDYMVPAFTYRNAAGETIIQWAHGAALMDPGFGQIYWSATLQRAAAEGKSGPARPYRFARTFYATDAAGKRLVDLNAMDEMKPYLAEFYAPGATAPLPATASGVTDQTPLELAAKIDITAFSVAENSANQLGEAIGMALGGGGNAKAFGLTIDYLLNYGVLPGSSGAAGLATNQQHVTEAANGARALTEYMQTVVTSSAAPLKAAMATLADLKAQHLLLDGKLSVQIANIQNSEDFAKATATMKQLADLDSKCEKALKSVQDIAVTRGRAIAILSKLSEGLPKLEALQTAMSGSKLYAAAGAITNLLTKTEAVKTWMGRLGYTANAFGILKNVALLATFDPTKGDISTNGNYDTTFAIITEPLVNLIAIGGDFASGNVYATVADVANFAGGRMADIYMSYRGMEVALAQADEAGAAIYDHQASPGSPARRAATGERPAKDHQAGRCHQPAPARGRRQPPVRQFHRRQDRPRRPHHHLLLDVAEGTQPADPAQLRHRSHRANRRLSAHHAGAQPDADGAAATAAVRAARHQHAGSPAAAAQRPRLSDAPAPAAPASAERQLSPRRRAGPDRGQSARAAELR